MMKDSTKTPPVPCQPGKTYPKDKSIPYPLIYAPAVAWLQKAWGIPIRATSFIRNSPGHVAGYALDIAPTIPRDRPYAPREGRDPLLTNRQDLLAKLTRALKYAPSGFFFFLETDHVHVAIVPYSLMQKYGIDTAAVFRWAYMKEGVYPQAGQDWERGRRNSPLVPEPIMNTRWPNKTGIALRAGKLVSIPQGQTLVTDMAAIHKAVPDLNRFISDRRAIKWPALTKFALNARRRLEQGDVIVPAVAVHDNYAYSLMMGLENADVQQGGTVKSPAQIQRDFESYSGEQMYAGGPTPIQKMREVAANVVKAMRVGIPRPAWYQASPDGRSLYVATSGVEGLLQATVKAKYGPFSFRLLVKALEPTSTGGFHALIKPESVHGVQLLTQFKKPDTPDAYYKVKVSAREVAAAMTQFAKGQNTSAIPIADADNRSTGITALLSLVS